MAARIELADRPIIITGGGSGIGEATAIACADVGMPVVVAGRRADMLHAVVSRIQESGGEASACPVDVTEADHAAHLIQHCHQAYGQPWAVFANAGRGLDRAAHLTTSQELRDIFEVNFFAAHHLLSEAAAHMIRENSGGHLMMCASCVSKFSPPYHAAYAATKAAQDLYCQSMRLELAPAGIHVSTVHPITTTTDFFDVSADVSGRSGTRSGLDHTPKMFRQPPEKVSRAIVKCLRKPVPEVWTSNLVRMTAALRNIFPKLMDREMRRMLEPSRIQGEDASRNTH